MSSDFKALATLTVAMYFLAGLTVGTFTYQADQVTCQRGIPIAYVAIGATWPVTGIIVVLGQLFGDPGRWGKSECGKALQ